MISVTLTAISQHVIFIHSVIWEPVFPTYKAGADQTTLMHSPFPNTPIQMCFFLFFFFSKPFQYFNHQKHTDDC